MLAIQFFFCFGCLFFIINYEYIVVLAFSGWLYFFILCRSFKHVGALDRDPHGFRSGRGDGQLRDQALARHRGQSLRGTVPVIEEGIPKFLGAWRSKPFSVNFDGKGPWPMD